MQAKADELSTQRTAFARHLVMTDTCASTESLARRGIRHRVNSSGYARKQATEHTTAREGQALFRRAQNMADYSSLRRESLLLALPNQCRLLSLSHPRPAARPG